MVAQLGNQGLCPLSAGMDTLFHDLRLDLLKVQCASPEVIGLVRSGSHRSCEILPRISEYSILFYRRIRTV